MPLFLDFKDENRNPRQLGVDIEYVQFPEGHEQAGEISHTALFLFDPSTDEVLADGVAYKHPKDQFSKLLGRKIAFQRAVDNFTNQYSYKGEDGFIHYSTIGQKIRADLWKSFVSKVRLPSARRN